jgi:cardiolipin synthase
MLNFANILTMSRIAAIPAIVGLLLVPGLVWHWIALALFIIACVTDWFDGYVARRLDQVSPLGRFLDPIADKLVVAAVLLVLVAIRHIDGWAILAALIILCREILVSGLREFLAELRVGVPVSMLAKWKTTVQMVALGFLIVAKPESEVPIRAMLIGEILLWVAAAMTVITGYDYMTIGLKHMAAAQPAKSPPSQPEPRKTSDARQTQ